MSALFSVEKLAETKETDIKANAKTISKRKQFVSYQILVYIRQFSLQRINTPFIVLK